MRRQISHYTSLFVVFSLLLALLPSGNLGGVVSPKLAAISATTLPASPTIPIPTTTPQPTQSPMPTPIQLTVTPVVDPHLPSLFSQVEFSRHQMGVGDSVAITITVINQAPDAAHNMNVSATLPGGVGLMAISPQGKAGLSSIQTPIPTASPTPGSLSWTVSQLNGGASVSFTATVQLTSPPTGGALVISPAITADGLSQPVVATRGVLVVDHSRGAASVPFSPGSTATLRSSDNVVTVNFPASAYTQALTLKHDFQPPLGTNPAPELAGKHYGWGVFYLNATDILSREVHQFAQPLTITVGYTPQQLDALGISEADLTLFWYNEANHTWQSIPTIVDPTTHTARASVNHFSGYQLGDGSSPSSAFIPSLQGFQVGLYSGDGSYSYPIDIPAGPNGVKPSLNLSYDSAATDGKGGVSIYSQSGWAGKGWSLDTGSIGLNLLNVNGSSPVILYYSLVLNGQSYDLVGECEAGYTCINNNLTTWAWHPTNEAFIRVRVVGNGNSYGCTAWGGRGGCYGTTSHNAGTPYPRYKWQVWTKDGMMYEYAEDAWWGWKTCDIDNSEYMQSRQWKLSKVQDTYGNVINYNYLHTGMWHDYPGGCQGVEGNIDYDVSPTSITWGGAVNTGSNPRFEAVFTSTARTSDTSFDTATSQMAGVGPHEARRLDAIGIFSNQSYPSYNANAWDLMRQYNLSYSYDLTSDYSKTSDGTYFYADDTHPKLTLMSIQRVATDTVTALPATTFTYTLASGRGTGLYPAGSWNRLVSVNNGQGGVLTINYENIGPLAGGAGALYANNRRVTSKVAQDGRGHSYTWQYSYTHPAYNWLGTEYTPNDYPNSASLFYDWASGDTSHLAHQALSEFRGHSYVVETDPSGNQTEHWFYQGDVSCFIGWVGDICYNLVVNRQFLKGMEYRTVSWQGAVGASKLSEITHTFGVNFFDQGYDSYVGLWHAFTHEDQTTQTTWGLNSDSGGSLTAAAKNTYYTYETAALPSGGYGRLLTVQEKDNANNLLRRTTHSYATVVSNTTSFIADRTQADTIYDGAANRLAMTFYAYDGSTTFGYVGSHGSLTLVRKIYDANTGGVLHGVDTAYSYDASYGNLQSTTTYSSTTSNGTATWTGSTWSLSASSGVARTTTIHYDTTFNTYSKQIDPPTVNGLTLSEYADYEFKLGAMTAVTDVNGQVTTASYDGFGRLYQVFKPGDTTYPSFRAYYYNAAGAQPFKYSVWRYENESAAYRPIQSFYDGLGRVIQTKSESVDGAQNIVADKFYDVANNRTKQSQPRYVNESGTPFGQYTALDSDPNERWTITTNDALGRPLNVVAPDNTTTTMTYWVPSGSGSAATSVDANLHKKQQLYDVFGRLTTVKEYTGTNPYPLYATTVYTYSPLDLLTNVRDNAGNLTSISYDTLGRKGQMTDPDMGTWSYAYDTIGNLTGQTDAKNQTIVLVSRLFVYTLETTTRRFS